MKIGEEQKIGLLYASADVLFLPLKIGEEQNTKVYMDAHALFFSDIP